MKKYLPALCFLLCLILSGCLPEWGDGLLQAPQLPGDYLSLQQHINSLLEKGAIQVSPSGGDYRNPVQLIDLDGDGVDEVLAFFRDASGSADFSVYLFQKTDNKYTPCGSLVGHGLNIKSVCYPRRLSSGALAVAICWDQGESANEAMTVGVFENGSLTEETLIKYSDVFISSLGGGAENEIVTFVRDEDSARYHARIYSFENGHLTAPASVPLSAGILGVARVVQGRTTDGIPALFIDEISSGKGYITDVLTAAGSPLDNITLDSTSGTSTLTYRSVSVPCALFEIGNSYLIPTAYPLPGYSEQSSDSQWRLTWNSVDSRGVCTPELDTYYNRLEGWYLIWPEAWKDKVTVHRSVSGAKNSTTFLFCETGKGEDIPLFSILVANTEDKSYSPPAGAILIGADTNNTYYLSFSAGEGIPQKYLLDEAQVRELFRIIPKEASSS